MNERVAAAIRDLVVANRILGNEGVVDAFGHISIRHPENAGRYFLACSRSPGLVTEDAEIRRLTDLLLFNDVPYRGGQILEEAIQKKAVNVDDKVYDKLANCWIAAGELDKAIDPLERGGELASSGERWQ